MKLILLIPIFMSSVLVNAQGKFFGGNGDGFATASITNVVLPLRIISFSASVNGNAVDAFLSISTTDVVCTIQLQRSNDGLSFFNIDSVKADYPGITASSFLFTDASQRGANTYYRTSITNCGGKIVYSSIVSIKKIIEQNVFTYSADNRSVRYSVSKSGRLELVNTLGQTVYQTNLSAGSGYISLPAICKGVYMIRYPATVAARLIIR
jgi:hypothetical protein